MIEVFFYYVFVPVVGSVALITFARGLTYPPLCFYVLLIAITLV